MSQQKWAYTWLQILRDLLFVLRELWLLLGLNLIAVFAFLILPQGTDMLLSILEATHLHSHFVRIIFLLVAVFFWSISSEFCIRFLIYMTDNSGHRLSPERVLLRKSNQKSIAKFFLFFPTLLVAAAFIKAYLQNISDIDGSWWILCLILFALALLLVLLYYLYLPDQKNKKPVIFHWMHLSEEEKIWTSKLYGIFNDFRIDLREDEIPLFKKDLPRNTLLPDGSMIPASFQLKKGPIKLSESTSIQVWMYRIPLIYFKNLLQQFGVLVIISCVIIVYFSFASTYLYQSVGAIALICFSFATWQILYTLLHFLDKAQPIPKIHLPFRILVLIWICFCSYINNDHPVRCIPKQTNSNIKPVSVHFKEWIRNVEQNESYQNEDRIPVFFIASEGGALRTGAYTAMLLAKLQDSFPNFKKHIYLYCGISGGALGLQYFQTLPDKSEHLQENCKSTRSFFGSDFLSPVTGKLVFAEMIHCFLPFHMAVFDRAIALEKAWEESWANANKNKQNLFAAAFDTQIGMNKPAIFINTVEAETGMPSVWSNTMLDSSFAFASDRDLQHKFHVSIPYSTAINLGTRFPFISPAAMLELNRYDSSRIRLHYMDGGYYENKGQSTILEILQAIQPEKYPEIQPYIIQFNYSQDDLNIYSVRFANEWLEIFKGLENTRYARASLSAEATKNYMRVHYNTQQIVNLNLEISEKKLPMNWILSQTAMNRIDAYTDLQMKLKIDSIQMQQIFSAIKNIKP